MLMPQESTEDDSADYEAEEAGPSHKSPAKKSKTGHSGHTPRHLKKKGQSEDEPIDLTKTMKEMMALEDARAKDVSTLNKSYKLIDGTNNNMYILTQGTNVKVV